jgi:dCMP deaminase
MKKEEIMDEVRERPPWDVYWMNIAEDIAARSTCHNIQVGAVITINNRIIGTGYNGSPAGFPNCIDEPQNCEKYGKHCVRAVHAEVNAIVQAARFGNGIEGSTLYTIYSPCVDCAKLIVNAGIKRIVYVHEYHDDRKDALQLLKNAGVETCKL